MKCSPPTIRETSSAYSPAAFTTWLATIVSRSVRSSTPSFPPEASSSLVAGQEDDAGGLARSKERFHQCLGVDDAALRRVERADRVHLRLARGDERGIDHSKPFDAVGSCLWPAGLRATPAHASSLATMILPVLAWGTACAAQNS